MPFIHGFVMPSEEFSSLNLGKVISLDNVEDSDGKTGPANKVYKIVVCEVHGGPPHPHYIGTEGDTGLREQVVQVKGMEGGPTSVKGGEGTEDDRGSRERGCVEFCAKEDIYSCQSAW